MANRKQEWNKQEDVSEKAISPEQLTKEQKPASPKFGPLTTKILELVGEGVKLSKDWNYKDELTEILAEKYKI